MAHVLVFHNDPSLRDLLTIVCEEDGHAVTSVATTEDALMVLRTSLHPIVAIVERIHSSRRPFGQFFEVVSAQPERYSQHRYIALHVYNLTDDEQALLQSLGVYSLSIPFPMEMLADLVADAARSIAGR